MVKSLPADVRAALTDCLGVAMGYVPLGIGMGIVAANAGLAWWWPALLGLTVYSGAMQFVMVPMLVGPISLVSVALATLAVQFRHVFYGLSYPRAAIHSRAALAYGAFALTDEAYALLASRPASQLTQRRVLLTQLLCQASWVLGCLLGGVGGMFLPIPEEVASFVLTALFVVLLIEAYKSSPAPLELLICGVCAIGAVMILPSYALGVALGAAVALLLVLGWARGWQLAEASANENNTSKGITGVKEGE